jgi:hypothetical protein
MVIVKKVANKEVTKSVPRTVTVNRSLVPATMRVKLRYAQEGYVNAASASSTADVFRANDLYDPYQTGVGHQPMGFDELCALYTRFTVVTSRIEVYMVPTSVTAGVPAFWGILLSSSTGSAAAVDVGTLYENENVSEMCPVAMNQLAGSTTAFSGKRTLSFNAKKWFNAKDILSNSAYSCTAAASPTAVAYYSIWAAGVDAGDAVKCEYMMRIEYDVLCSQEAEVSPS